MTTLAEFDAVVLEVISEVGAIMTYTKLSQGVYDPATGSVDVSSNPIPVKAMLLDLTLQSNGLSTKYGTDIQTGDKEAYFIPPMKFGGPSITVDPVNDKFTAPDGTVYTIVTFKEINPSGSNPILYSLYLRR